MNISSAPLLIIYREFYNEKNSPHPSADRIWQADPFILPSRPNRIEIVMRENNTLSSSDPPGGREAVRDRVTK